MRNTLTIARREFRSYFNSQSAYIVGGLFLALVGYLFWSSFFLNQRVSVRGLFQPAYMVSVFIITY